MSARRGSRVLASSWISAVTLLGAWILPITTLLAREGHE